MAQRDRPSNAETSDMSSAKAQSSQITTSKVSGKAASVPSAEPASLSTLSICRNKHWRFISSFHGPWLQLPHELLESLAYGNYFSSRPHIIDAAIFFDVVRIRRLVDEATNLSVRAVNGTTSSALSTSLNAGHGSGRGGNGTKLSGERRFRMRELAVKKLSEAYHLDEIAASVATMQSASSLEEVAKMVLQRSPNDVHAKYVHFFHEKIPSRALAESTSLDPLNEILSNGSVDSAVLRTRALTRIFKEDYIIAAKDLTEALSNIKRDNPQHAQSLKAVSVDGGSTSTDTHKWNPKYDTQKLADDDKPTGIESQIYFQRAGIYLSSACDYVEQALKKSCKRTEGKDKPLPEQSQPGLVEDNEAYNKVKLYAKRALRDFTSFLSRLEYSPGIVKQPDLKDKEKVDDLPKLVERTHIEEASADSSPTVSTASSIEVASAPRGPDTRSVRIYQVSDLFTPTPPTNLPVFPTVLSNTLVKAESGDKTASERLTGAAEPSEIVSYHPLLTEALHGLLLCHALLQTEQTQIRKYALMVARLVSLSDGFPVFVAARSASRADWIDVLSQNKSWLDIGMSWDKLCKSTKPSKEARATNRKVSKRLTDQQTKSKSSDTMLTQYSQADRKTSSATSAKATDVPETEEVNENEKAPYDLKAYSLGTERADIISRWILEAAVLPDAPAKPRKGKKKGTRQSTRPIES